MPEKFKIMALTDLMSRGWGLFRGSQTMASPVSLHGRRKWPQSIDTDSISSDCRAPFMLPPRVSAIVYLISTQESGGDLSVQTTAATVRNKLQHTTF